MLSFVIIVIIIRLFNFLLLLKDDTATFYMMKTINLLKEAKKGSKQKEKLNGLTIDNNNSP